MGDEETSRQETTERSSSTTSLIATPTEQERELNELDLAIRRAIQGGLLGTQQAGLDLTTAILTGKELPGNLAGIAGGISPDVTNRVVEQSLLDVDPGFEKLGLRDAGVKERLKAELSADIRAANERFNIENRLALLRTGQSGQLTSQQPALQLSAALGQRLAGLRPTVTTGQFSGEQQVRQKEPSFTTSDAIDIATTIATILAV